MEEGGGTGLTAHQIYEALTGGPGSNSLDTAQQAAYAEAQLEADRAERILRIASKIQAGWQGGAAEGAYGAAVPLADAAREGAANLEQADNLLAMQSEVFNSVKHSVRPVPEKPPESNILNDMVPWETDLDREIKQYQADVQHNMAVYGMYDGESLSNQERLPREYPTITDPGGTVSVASSGGEPGGPPDGGPGYPLPRSGGGDVAGSSGGSGEGGGGPAGPPSGSGGGQGSQQGTAAQEFVPGPINAPGVQSPPSGGLPPSRPPSGGGSGPVAPVVPIGGGQPGREPGSGPEGGRGGSGSGGPGGRGGVGEGGRGPGGDLVGRGPGVGGLSAEEAAARRAGGAGARGGVAGMGGMSALGGGRGRGGEDKEHERKSFLREADPEAIFGTNEVTAPPIIGEEQEEN